MEIKIPTPHISAKKNEIAPIVIMPGDPKRAEWIAKNFLQDAKLVSEVRGMSTYTGYYQKQKVTIMPHGMGMAGASIYFYELFKFYEVQKIIRIGTSGSYNKNFDVGDVAVASDVVTISNWWEAYGLKKPFSHFTCKDKLMEKIKIINTELPEGKKIKQAVVNCNPVFYSKDASLWKKRAKVSDMTEMESYALYTIATDFKKEAIALLTVADTFYSKKIMSWKERQDGLTHMVKISLKLAVS